MKLNENIYSNSDKIISGMKIKITYIGLVNENSLNMYIRYISKKKNNNKFEMIKCKKNKLGFYVEVIPEECDLVEIYFKKSNNIKLRKNKNGKKYIFKVEKEESIIRKEELKLPLKEDNNLFVFMKKAAKKLCDIIKYIPRQIYNSFEIAS